jgi:hypothetical protein
VTNKNNTNIYRKPVFLCRIIREERRCDTMNDKTIQFLTNISYLQELMNSTYSDAYEAYDVIESQEDDLKYVLALNYLTLAQQSYLEFKRVVNQYGLERNELDVFIQAFDHYKVQLKEFITDRDTNISYVYSAIKSFEDARKEVDEFLSNTIKASQR